MKRLVVWGVTLALVTVFTACGGDDSEDIAAFCELAAEASANATQEMTQEEEAQAFEEFRDAAPDEIKEDVEIVIGTALESSETGDESLLTSEEYLAAGANLSEWGEENCPQAD